MLLSLARAVLSILITAPLGASLVDYNYRRLLKPAEESSLNA